MTKPTALAAPVRRPFNVRAVAKPMPLATPIRSPGTALPGPTKPMPAGARVVPPRVPPAQPTPTIAAQTLAPSTVPAPNPPAPIPPAAPVSAGQGSEAPAATQTPIVTLLSPIDGSAVTSTDVDVKLHVKLPAGHTLLALRALVDGRLAAQSRGVAITSIPVVENGLLPTHTLKVSIPAQNSVLTILAETTPTRSQPVSVRLRWSGATQVQDQIAMLQPKLYVLSIGVSDYQNEVLRLQFAAKDAADLSETFRAQGKSLYRSVEIKLLTDRRASKNNILDGLEWLQKQTTAKDIAILFLAGHGVTDPSTGGYYFLPYDADPEAMKRTMIPESEIRDTLAAIPGKVLLFLDSCHSGKVFSANQTRGVADLTSLIGELSSAESGVVVFAASTGRQSSQESSTWNNGAFTKALIEGLSGRADYQKTGRVTVSMLDLYISERVKELTQGKQTPTSAKPATIPDFPLSMVRDLRNEDVDLVR